MTPLVSLEGIGRRFRIGPETIDAVKDVSLEIQRGELVSITGHSGSGKTVLLNIVGLLDRPTKGRYLLLGRETNRVGDDELTILRNRRIGFVFQSSHMLPRATVAENVAVPLIYRRLPPKQALAESRTQLKRVGLAELAERKPNELSGGQLQRVAFARALVTRPDLILADEPSAALDPESAEQIMMLLMGAHRSDGATVILVTHKHADALRCPRQFVMREGHLEERLETAAVV